MQQPHVCDHTRYRLIEIARMTNCSLVRNKHWWSQTPCMVDLSTDEKARICVTNRSHAATNSLALATILACRWLLRTRQTSSGGAVAAAEHLKEQIHAAALGSTTKQKTAPAAESEEPPSDGSPDHTTSLASTVPFCPYQFQESSLSLVEHPSWH